MREEYNSILTTPADTDGHFGHYRYISKTQISANVSVYLKY